MPLSTDPVTLRCDANGNLDPLALYSASPFDAGLTAFRTGVRTRLRMVVGEWFLNLDAGLPLFERDGVNTNEVILGNRFDLARTRAPILDALLSTPGALAVSTLEISFDRSARLLSIFFRVQCVFGEVTDTLTIEVPGG